MKKTVIASGIAMALGNAGVQAATTFDFAGAFTFYDAGGALSFTDNTVTGTFTLPDATTPPSGSFTTTTPFTGYTWVADVDTMFFYDTAGAATQTFTYDWTNFAKFEAGGLGSYSCRTGVSIDGCAGLGGITLSSAVRGYSFDLTNAGQFGAGVFFDWSVNLDIPVLTTLQITNDPTTSGGVMQVASFDGRVSAINPNPTAPAYTNSPDGLPGNRMLVGPFPNQTPAFGGTMTPQVIPVPAAVWLFGSGLLGLVGIARRKKA